MVADISKARVELNTGPVFDGRFLFWRGRAAVWQTDDDTKTGRRVLFATDGTFLRTTSAQEPNIVEFPDGSFWRVTQIATGGGGCCGQRGSLSEYTIGQLLSDDFVTTG